MSMNRRNRIGVIRVLKMILLQQDTLSSSLVDFILIMVEVLIVSQFMFLFILFKNSISMLI